jgi:uncharacterized protein YtpQ (UPF0354 family)
MSETPPNPNILKPEEFSELVADRVDADPESAMQVEERAGLTLRVRGAAQVVNADLRAYYDAYTRYPEQIDTIITTVLQGLQGIDPEERSQSRFADIGERVFPMLKPISLLVDIRERNLPMVVYRPFLADLIITYVIEDADRAAYINEQHLDHWEIGAHELHDQAIANLRRRTDERGNMTVTGEGAQRLIIFSTQDGHDAARLLLPAILDGWRSQFPGRMVIGIPNRDFLIAFSDADDTILANIARQIQIDAAQREHGLTDQLFTLENGVVREYAWD